MQKYRWYLDDDYVSSASHMVPGPHFENVWHESWVSIMATDALAPSLGWSSAAMALSVLDKQNGVIHVEKY